MSLKSPGMDAAATTRRNARTEPLRGWRGSLVLLMPMAFLLVMFFFYPFREIFEYNYDEGGQLMKSLLLARGYSLYDEIWSDQPPLLTYLIAGGIRAVNAGVDDARILVLLFSSALLAGAAYILNREWGLWHAVVVTVIIFLLPFYVPLSAAVMVGLPAIALAVLSLAVIVLWHSTHKSLYLVLSALILCLSVSTKLFTGFLAPIFALGILAGEWGRAGKAAAWRSFLLWSISFTAFCLAVILFLIGPANVGHLVVPHLEAREALKVNTTISDWLREAWPVFIVTGVGCVLVFLERRWVSLYLIAWMVGAYVFLSLHAPVFYHQQLLVSVPAAMLAGIALGEIPRMIRSRAVFGKRLWLAALALAGFGVYLSVRLPLTLPEFHYPPSLREKAYNSPWPQQQQVFMIKMENRAAETRWIFTDIPMYAFRVGLINPPYLSFVTAKRLSTLELTEDKMIEVIQEYRPEQVLIGRRAFPKVKQYLAADYRLLYDRGKRYLYLRKDLSGD